MVNHRNRNQRPPLNAENLIPHLKAAQTFLRTGTGYFANFSEHVYQRLTEEQIEEAGALLRGTLMICTALHDHLDIPSIFGFGAGKSEFYCEVLHRIDDPTKLELSTLRALAFDAYRLDLNLADLPEWMQDVMKSMHLTDEEPDNRPAWLVDFSDDQQFIVQANTRKEAIAQAKELWAKEVPGRKAEDAPFESVERWLG